MGEGLFKSNGEVKVALNLIIFSKINDYITLQSINYHRNNFGAIFVFKYNLFRFYVIHDDHMLINILKKSTLALHKDETITYDINSWAS